MGKVEKGLGEFSHQWGTQFIDEDGENDGDWKFKKDPVNCQDDAVAKSPPEQRVAEQGTEVLQPDEGAAEDATGHAVILKSGDNAVHRAITENDVPG